MFSSEPNAFVKKNGVVHVVAEVVEGHCGVSGPVFSIFTYSSIVPFNVCLIHFRQPLKCSPGVQE